MQLDFFYLIGSKIRSKKCAETKNILIFLQKKTVINIYKLVPVLIIIITEKNIFKNIFCDQ